MIFSDEILQLSAVLPDVIISKAADYATIAFLERYARRMEAPLRDAFLTAIRNARSEVTLQILEQAIRSIDPAAAIRHAVGGLEFDQMRETLAQMVEASGQRATTNLEDASGQILGSFNLTNPYAVRYAQTEVGLMIKEITQSTMEGIQNLISNAIVNGIPPRLAAKQIQGMIGLTEAQTQWVLNYENKLISAGVADVDVKVQRYADKVLRYRALNIARSETLRAVNGGQQAAWEAAVDQGMLPPDSEKVWIVTKDEKLCPNICEPMDGQQVPLNSVFITGEGERVDKPPAHPQCRCAIALAL